MTNPDEILNARYKSRRYEIIEHKTTLRTTIQIIL